MTRHLISVVFALGAAREGCGFVNNNAPLCDPGEVRTCTCNTGAPGEQTCQSDGQDYLSCACNDAGVSRDAGVPGPPDSSTPTPAEQFRLPAAPQGVP